MPHIYAVIIGVNASAETGQKKLRYSQSDAEGFYRFLTSPIAGSVPETNIRKLTGTGATRTNILKATEYVFNKATKNDLVIFYFSGHGVNSGLASGGYLVPFDFQPDDVLSSGVPMKQLMHIMSLSKAKMKEVYIDACHAGLFQNDDMDKGNPGDQNLELATAFMTTFDSSGSGFIGILSSKGSEESREDSTFKQGVFTHFLLKGLMGGAKENKDGVITILSLESYLSRNIPAYTENSQHSMIVGNYDNEFPMSVTHTSIALKEAIKRNPGIAKQVRGDFLASVNTRKESKIYSDSKCIYGYLTFVNKTTRQLTIYARSALVPVGGGFQSAFTEDCNVVLQAGGSVESDKLKIGSKIMGDGKQARDYTFFIRATDSNGKPVFARLAVSVEAFKEDTATIMEDDLDFSNQAP